MIEKRIILQHAGRIDPENIDDYIRAGGYLSSAKAMARTSTDIIEEIIKSGLRGRGGAGYPTGLKARVAYQTITGTGEKYIVCNADEGEPGTFKDRFILENDPHLILEGIIIAAFAIQARKAFIYLRGEYFRSIYLVDRAVKEAKERGYLGKNIFSTDYSLDIEVKQGAGSYLCGEELTLIESLEGKRGYPRLKPPFPAERGLSGSPTLVINVETLANLPLIVGKGSGWFSSIGLNESPGTKLYSISGDVKNPGVFETEMSTTLRELIYGFGGGMAGDKRFKAALLGGAAGTFVDESVLDTPAGFDTLRSAGATLGSGAIVVMDETRDIVKMIRSILKFFKHESCGKCVPCRVGTTYLYARINEIITEKNITADNLDELVSQAEYMANTSLCPLGQSPVLPLRSMKRFFHHEYFQVKPDQQ